MFTEAFPILTTRDLPRLAAFYQEVLEFAATYRFPTEGDPQYVGLELGAGSQLGIGADAAVARLRGHGATITGEPQDMPWGERAAHAEDPDGNRLVILSRLTG